MTERNLGTIKVVFLSCSFSYFVVPYQEIRGFYTPPSEVVLEDLSLPGLAELKGHWHGSLDASGGGNGDTLV